jgi:DNA-binding response OmpR family regulator
MSRSLPAPACDLWTPSKLGAGGRPRSKQVMRFGVFEIDFRSGELRKGGLRMKLQDQPFQILSMLPGQSG